MICEEYEKPCGATILNIAKARRKEAESEMDEVVSFGTQLKKYSPAGRREDHLRNKNNGFKDSHVKKA